MSHVIKCHGLANGAVSGFEGQYLESYDPDADVPGVFTNDLARAKRYPDAVAALTEWRRVRTVGGGRRPDGEADRPLTAFSIEVRKVDD